MRTRSLVLAASLALIPAALTAQIPDKFKNLKVLPADISRDSLITTMRGFAGGLGVRCTFCHVGGPDGGIRGADFASDDKPTKRRARFMLAMVDSLNRAVLPQLPDRHQPMISIQCVTCHRGSELPQTLPMVLSETIQKSGPDSAVAQYKALREDMTSGRYDFREPSLDELAEQLIAAGNNDAAIAMLKLNQSYYPDSSNIDELLGNAYKAAGQKDQAIDAYKAALQKDPRNRRAQQALDALQGG